MVSFSQDDNQEYLDRQNYSTEYDRDIANEIVDNWYKEGLFEPLNYDEDFSK